MTIHTLAVGAGIVFVLLMIPVLIGAVIGYRQHDRYLRSRPYCPSNRKGKR